MTGASTIDGATVPRSRRDIAAVTLDGETVIHRHGRVHVLDPVASLVWASCDGDASVDQIARELADAFGTALDTVRRDVGAAVEQLRLLGLVTEDAGIAAAVVPEAALLMDPPGSCASCAERPWTFRSSYRVGERIVTVGTNRVSADAVIRTALAAHLVPTPHAAATEPPFFACDIHDHGPDAEPQPLHLLHRGDTVAARSRRPDRIITALVAHLGTYADLGRLGLAAVNGVVVGRAGRAMIIEPPADLVRFGHALGRAGIRIADMPVALVGGPDGEVVVGAPGLDVDIGAIDALAVESSEREPDPLPWGRYRLCAIGIAAPASPSTALLALAPDVGDHRDHDGSLAALVEVLRSVPTTEAVDAEGISAHLG